MRSKSDYRSPTSLAQRSTALVEKKCLRCRQYFPSTDSRRNWLCAPCGVANAAEMEDSCALICDAEPVDCPTPLARDIAALADARL